MNRLVGFKLVKKTCSLVLKVLLSIGWPNKRLKRDCQRVATLVQNCSSVFAVYFLSSAVRCQPLSRALAEVKKNHKIKRLFFLVWGSSFTPESQHFSAYLASGTVREAVELTEVCLREVVCLFISLVWLLWFWSSFALKWISRTWLLASSKEFFVNWSLRSSSVFLLFLLCQVLFVG